MISLTAPRLGCTSFVLMRGFLVGPFCFQQGLGSFEEISKFRSIFDSIVEFKGHHHENIVNHAELRGDLFFAPYYSAFVPDPVHTTQSDIAAQIKVRTSATSTVTASCGCAVDGAVVCERSYNAYLHIAFAYDSFDRRNFSIYECQAQGTPPKVTGFIKYRYYIESLAGSVLTYGVQTVTYKSLTRAPVLDFADLSGQSVTFGDITKMMAGFEISSDTYKRYTKSRVVPFSTGNFGLSPSAVRAAVDVIALRMSLREGVEFPLEDCDYGDLAMRASAKVNANKVNMIAFLRDLRHPTEMIPKLANLRSLKGLAGNYLSVNYGVLPTVSDLKAIVEACKRISPYLDRNGLEIFTSAQSASTSDEEYSYTLENRLKLAIAKEDSGLDEIVSRLDNIGILPTFENLWDLVPYSFVLDWFLDVGKLLERIDTRMRLTRLNVEYVTMSRKDEIRKDLKWSSVFPFVGTISLGHYHRWVSDQCPVPPLSLHTSFDGFDHWLESAALLLQRKK